MAAIKLYNPKTQAFSAITPPVGDIPFGELVMLNVLIELQTITRYMEQDSHPLKDASDVRSDIVSEF